MVHAVGTLLEDTSYKQWKTSSAPPPPERTTYERMNRDTAVALATAAAHHSNVKVCTQQSRASIPSGNF